MKNLLAFVVMAGVFFTNTSCEKVVGEGPVVTETREVSAFHGVSLSIPGDVYFLQSPDKSLKLEAQQNILDEIETVVVNDILRIRFKHPNIRIRSHDPIVIRVENPEARLFELNGSGNINVENDINPAELQLTVSGSGTIQTEQVFTNKIRTTLSGSGRITTGEGEANEENISISGSGSVQMLRLKVKDADTQISGSGNMEVHATHTLKARISGSGTVFYQGDPTITKTISGSGAVVKL